MNELIVSLYDVLPFPDPEPEPQPELHPGSQQKPQRKPYTGVEGNDLAIILVYNAPEFHTAAVKVGVLLLYRVSIESMAGYLSPRQIEHYKKMYNESELKRYFQYGLGRDKSIAVQKITTLLLSLLRSVLGKEVSNKVQTRIRTLLPILVLYNRIKQRIIKYIDNVIYYEMLRVGMLVPSSENNRCVNLNKNNPRELNGWAKLTGEIVTQQMKNIVGVQDIQTTHEYQLNLAFGTYPPPMEIKLIGAVMTCLNEIRRHLRKLNAECLQEAEAAKAAKKAKAKLMAPFIKCWSKLKIAWQRQ